MADETTRQDVTEEATPIDEVAARADPSPPGADGKSKDPDASSPASTGKRPLDDAVEDEGEEHDDKALPPRKKARKDPAARRPSKGESTVSVDGGDVDPEGASKNAASNSPDGRDSVSSPHEPSTSAAPASVTPGLRTSFGTSSQNLAQNSHPDMVMYSPLTTEQRTQLVNAIRTGEAKAVPPVKKRDLEWTITPVRADWVVGTTWLEIFESTLDKWCESFLAENQKNIDEIGLAPNLLKQAFLRRLEADVTPNLPRTLRSVAQKQLKNPETSRLRNFASEFKPNAKKAARRAARKQAQVAKEVERLQQVTSGASTSTKLNLKPATNNTSDQPINAKMDVEMEDNDVASGPHQQPKVEMEEGEVDSGDANDVEMETDENKPVSPVPQAELDQRHRYYPGVPDEAAFCLTCAQYGHTTARCPEMTCKHCQGDHFKYECPTRQRCGKCKQLGHTKRVCPEKLAVAQGEATMECAICELHDHTEINCSELWQAYRPQPGNVKKVRSLPIFCYCCGSEGHFGGDCGLADLSTPPTKTWTIATASLYIDPASNEDALNYKNFLPPAAGIPIPIIPGRSIKPQSHVIYEESDDSGEADGLGFLRAPAAGPHKKQQQQVGTGTKIQIKSNINFGAPAGPSSSTQQTGRTQKPSIDPLPGTKTSRRYPQRQRNEWPEPQRPNPQPPARGGKNYSLRNGRSAPKVGQGDRGPKKERQQARQQQQPPLPPGPPPPHLPTGVPQQGPSGGRGGGGGGRGRGGFSGLSKRNRQRRGQSQNQGQGQV